MKQIKFLAIFLALFALVGCPTNQQQNKVSDKQIVKIGVIQSLTGEGKDWGKNGQDAIQLAFDQISAKNTKYKYELVWEDSQTDAAKAVTAFNKLVSVDKVKYCIVDVISSDVLAIAPLANQNKVIIISPGASNPKITEAGDYVFRNWASDALQGKEQAKATQDTLKWKNVAILKINNEYGVGLGTVYQQNLSDTKIVANESYEKGATDFRTQLQKIKEANPDGIYLAAYPEELPTILQQAKELGINKPFLGTETFESQDLINKVGNLANGLIYTFPKSPDETQEVVKNFRAEFIKKYGKPHGTPGDFAYDALYLFVNAIEANGDEVEKVKNALYQIKDYHGASGILIIDQNGDAIKPFELKTIKNSKFVKYE
jgi:branched-chain amino acid transport system substrate-binding protein